MNNFHPKTTSTPKRSNNKQEKRKQINDILVRMESSACFCNQGTQMNQDRFDKHLFCKKIAHNLYEEHLVEDIELRKRRLSEWQSRNISKKLSNSRMFGIDSKQQHYRWLRDFFRYCQLTFERIDEEFVQYISDNNICLQHVIYHNEKLIEQLLDFQTMLQKWNQSYFTDYADTQYDTVDVLEMSTLNISAVSIRLRVLFKSNTQILNAMGVLGYFDGFLTELIDFGEK
ncbi:hypothetical protein SNEBB_000165 [Seison nebaliae]|nr:hypothetical protein SNEBB_000165 [Seison nebaliae]